MDMPRPRFHWTPLEDRNPAWLGFTALAVLAVIIAVVLLLNSSDVGQRTVQADFAQAAQLEKGNQVTVAGVPVGTVSGMKLAGDHVAVTLSIDESVHLGAQTTAAIKLTTLLGNRYVELDPAGTGELPNGHISIRRTTVPYNLQTALQDATSTFSDVDADRLADVLNRTSEQLGGVPAVVPEALRNVQALSTVIADRRQQIGKLLTSTEQLTQVIRTQQSNIGALVTNGQSLLAEVQSKRQAIERLLAATTTMIQQLEPIAVDDQPEIRKLIDNLTQITGMLSKNDALIRNLLEVLPVPWGRLINALGSGPELDANVPGAGYIDSFMCALVRDAPQLKVAPYNQDCR